MTIRRNHCQAPKATRPRTTAYLALIPALLVCSLVLGGCAGLGNALKEPGVRLNKVVVQEVGIRGGVLHLMVELDNPNPFDLRGTGIELGFDVEGAHVGDVRLSDEFSVEKGGSTTLELPVRFEWAGVGNALRSALASGEIPYTMKGQIDLHTPWGAHSVPFTREGRAPLSSLGGALSIPTGR